MSQAITNEAQTEASWTTTTTYGIPQSDRKNKFANRFKTTQDRATSKQHLRLKCDPLLKRRNT
jgi:hypothetical protein